MSRILVDQVRSNSASGDAITLDGNGKCAINATTINSLTFPTSDGSADQMLKTNGSGALSFGTVAGGISEADSWRISSTFQNSAYHITSNWERFDASGEGKKGTGMTQSGGYFTFPSTGYWYIHFHATFYRGGNSTVHNQNIHIRTTTNDSSYSERARGVASMYSSSGNSGCGGSAETIFKCENTSTHKVIFGVEVGNQYVYTYGNTNNSMTNVVFIKLAEL